MKKNYRYEGEYRSSKEQGKQEVIEYILDKEKGSTIEFDKLAKMLGYNLEDEKEKRKFKSRMGVIKNFLIDKGYVLKSITGVGYYILKTKHISSYCYHTYIRKTENLLNKSARILGHAQWGELDEIRREEYNNVKELNMDVEGAILNTIESSRYYKKKNYYDSLED